jgi:tetratricopeptide (TPR) repeat protein/isopentenyldiphosphate isomerase
MQTFVGREAEINIFRLVLRGTLSHRILNVSGYGGVGKSTLIERFAEIAREAGSPVGLVNARRLADPVNEHQYHPVIETLIVLDATLTANGCETAELHQALLRYYKLHQDLTAKFAGREAVVASILQIGVTAIRAGSSILPIAKPMDELLTPELVTQVSKAVASYRSPADRQLIGEPVATLSGCLARALNASFEERRQPIVLLFDEFELVAPEIEAWLHRLFDDQYESLDPEVLLVIAGRLPLGQDWIARGQTGGPREIKQIELERFTLEEATRYLVLALGLDEAGAQRIAGHLSDASWTLPLVLRLLVSEPRSLPTLEDSDATLEFGLLVNELVDRLFDGQKTSEDQREAALAVAAARSFDIPTVEIILDCCGIREPRTYFKWLERQHFINPHAPAYTYYDLVRQVFLTTLRNDNETLQTELHQRLHSYYQKRVASEGTSERTRKLSIEAAYHELSAAKSHTTVVALNRVFRLLPDGYHYTLEWSRMFKQVADERVDLSERDKIDLQRLALLLFASWSLSNWASAEGKRKFDPALNIFFTSLYEGELPAITPQNTELWLSYFESRVRIAVGGAEEVDRARGELLEIWRTSEARESSGQGEHLLQFCVATDLAEAHTRRGSISEAITWSRKALRIAREDAAPMRQALALYRLSNNQKRQGRYRTALKNLDAAIKLFREHSSQGNNYHLGRFLLDKGNTHTYLKEAVAAEEAFESSRAYFRDLSPQSFAEVSHRLGWLKRMRGDLDGALEAHIEAVEQFRQLESQLGTGTDVEASTVPFVRAKALHSMGNVLAEMCRHDEAIACYDEAIAIFEHHGGRRYEAIAIKDGAWSRFVKMGPGVAEKELRRALSNLGYDGSKDEKSASHSATHQTEGWLQLSLVRSCSGRLEQATEALERAEGILGDDEDDRYLVARAKLQRALIGALRGDLNKIEPQLVDVEAYAMSAELRLWYLSALAALVRAAGMTVTSGASIDDDWPAEARGIAERWNGYAPMAIEELSSRLRLAMMARPHDQSASAARPLSAPDSSSLDTGELGDSDEELLDVYDSQELLLGQSTSHLVHVAGLWHRAFHCWIGFKDRQGTKMVVLQQRGPFKRDFPNYLDISVAGHYRAGEGTDGVVREFREELGLDVDPLACELLARRVVEEELENATTNREYQDIFLHVRPLTYQTYHLGYPEVAGAFHCDLELLLRLLDGRHPSVRCTGLVADSSDDGARVVEISASIDHFIPSATAYLRTVLPLLSDRLDRHDSGLERLAASRRQEEPVQLDDGSLWSVR